MLERDYRVQFERKQEEYRGLVKSADSILAATPDTRNRQLRNQEGDGVPKEEDVLAPKTLMYLYYRMRDIPNLASSSVTHPSNHL